MAMFVEDATYPSRNGKKEHIVAVSIRPVWHGHSDTHRCHDAAATEQEKRRDKREENPCMDTPANCRPTMGIPNHATFGLVSSQANVLGCWLILRQIILLKPRHAILVSTVINGRSDGEVPMARR